MDEATDNSKYPSSSKDIMDRKADCQKVRLERYMKCIRKSPIDGCSGKVGRCRALFRAWQRCR